MGALEKQNIYLTFDVDWLSDEYLETTINILNNFDCKATIFATHESKLLKNLDPNRFEIGLHPNFDKGDGVYDLSELMRLKNIYPDAVGTRSHTLFFTSRLLPELEKCELKYESNIYLHKHEGLHPVMRSARVKSIPFNWSDDKHLELEENHFIDELPSLDNKGLNVFNFHPVHIFLNTDHYSRYESAKKYFNKKEMLNWVNTSTGVRTLFVQLCEYIQNNSIRTRQLHELI